MMDVLFLFPSDLLCPDHSGHGFILIIETQRSAIATAWTLYTENEDMMDSIIAYDDVLDRMAVPTKWE